MSNIKARITEESAKACFGSGFGIAEQFCVEGEIESVVPFGNGHINDTYLVTVRDSSRILRDPGSGAVVNACSRFVLQRINSDVFHSPEDVMHNMGVVTEHIRQTGDRTLSIIPARSGELFCRDGDDHWRMTAFIEGTHSCEKADDTAAFGEIGKGYGRFLALLADLPADSLSETISHFHDARHRYDELMAACAADPARRASAVSAEIDFAVRREAMTDTLNDGVASGRLPLRITHNDTKINNILMDNESGKAVCVIDLDTVMPGLVINDFADAIRSGACTGCEDEKDLSKVELDLKLFEAFASGFFSEYRSIGRTELDMIPDACVLMALECGMRFLTDYLQGDIYFKTDYEAQNLDRCRAQFRIAEDMERKKTDMRSIIQRISSQMSQSY